MRTTTVIKVGGQAMAGASTLHEDVAILRESGARPVVVHGGGPQITARLERLRIPWTFAGGRRVTTAEAMEVVRTVLVDEVNAALVAALGPHAVSVPDVLTATQLDPDLGHVGDVTAVDTATLDAVLDAGRVPVVATVGYGTDGTAYNVNADTAAAAIAVALRAQHADFLTDVAGLYADPADPETLIPALTATALAARLPTLRGGMVPKMEACLRAVRGGVGRARIVDGRLPHALLRDGGTAVIP